MKKYFKILRVKATDLVPQVGNYPVTAISPFGPPFESKEDGKNWLKENAENGQEYFFTRFYTTSAPDGLVVAQQKTKEIKHVDPAK
ncbi:hypothetical protein GCM10023149_16330 [Mucilaginibacter gynuensis]|uniref:Uncharacterized protein n=1 Tax=Mucilaginibacter gynuensis TaxID=1302236 RepID=A0ABP8G6M0_9SPHI